MFKPSVPVLMYHHVRPQGGMIACTPENFESQLQWLQKKGYRSLSLDEFAQHLAGKNMGKAVLITFDDGYLNNWVYAFPLLKKYGFKATIFLVTSWLNHGEVRPNADSSLSLPDSPEHAQCEQLIEQGRSDDVILRWAEVQAMKESGLIEFHSHTHTHTRWDKMIPEQKNEKIKWELEQSQKVLNKELGQKSPHLCWPQGYYDQDYIAIAQELGFRYLYTTDAFGRNTSATLPTQIHRFAVRNRPGSTLAKRIRSSHHPLIAPFFNGFKLWRRQRKS